MSWFSNLFQGYKNPADSANKYYDQIPGQTRQDYQPYVTAGQDSMHQNSQEYHDLVNDPGGKINKIGESYHQSPGFKFAMEQALGANGRSAAAGGMSRSPSHEFNNQKTATGLADQDYNTWLQHAQEMYNTGLSGNQDMMHQGYNASDTMSQQIAQATAQQGNLNYRGQQNNNEHNSSIWGNIGKGIGAASAFTPWGQAGGAFDTAYNRFYGGGKQ